ncbi:MAG: hypothetical protein ACM36B_07390 [Bacteroidota bacterium]
MESRPVPTLAGLVRSMQYIDARNGGLLVDFKPIKRYMEIAPGENHYERVRTVLDWAAFGAELGLLSAPDWGSAFADPADLRRFAAELRRYDLPMQAHHRAAFEQLGVVSPGLAVGYAAVADLIAETPAHRQAA